MGTQSANCLYEPKNDLICLMVAGFSDLEMEEMTCSCGDHLPSSNFHPNMIVVRGATTVFLGLKVNPASSALLKVSS